MHLVVDDGAGCLGVHGVQQAHGDAREFGGLDAGGVQDLGTEVGELGSLLEVELTHGLRTLDNTRVIVVHTIDVRPDLDFLCTEGSADEAGGVVGAAALQVVNLAVGVAADEALRDIDVVVGVGFQLRLCALADIGEVGLSILVGANHVEGREQDGVGTLLQQVVGDHVRGDDLALCQDDLLLERGEEGLCHRAQVVELLLQELRSLLAPLVGGVELLDMVGVFPFELVDDIVRTLGILLIEVVGDFHQGVRGAAHGREHHHFGLSVAGDELRDILHTLGTAYACASEFQYFHLVYVVFWEVKEGVKRGVKGLIPKQQWQRGCPRRVVKVAVAQQQTQRARQGLQAWRARWPPGTDCPCRHRRGRGSGR